MLLHSIGHYFCLQYSIAECCIVQILKISYSAYSEKFVSLKYTYTQYKIRTEYLYSTYTRTSTCTVLGVLYTCTEFVIVL